MVILDFRLQPPFDDTRGLSPLAVKALSYFTVFVGDLRFIVNDVDFSAELPILWFAWHLRHIPEWFAHGSGQYRFHNSEAARGFAFSKNSTQVTIFDSLYRSFSPAYSGTVSVESEELFPAISVFYKGVYEECSGIYPALNEDPALHAWLYRPYLDSDSDQNREY
jgi:hypothetical protein